MYMILTVIENRRLVGRERTTGMYLWEGSEVSEEVTAVDLAGGILTEVAEEVGGGEMMCHVDPHLRMQYALVVALDEIRQELASIHDDLAVFQVHR